MEDLINDINYLIIKDNLKKRNRTRLFVHKRMYLFSLLLDYKIPVSHIAKMFDYHHASVIHNVNQYKILSKQNDYMLNNDIKAYRRFLTIRKNKYIINDDMAKKICKKNKLYIQAIEENFSKIVYNIKQLNEKYEKKLNL